MRCRRYLPIVQVAAQVGHDLEVSKSCLMTMPLQAGGLRL